MVRMHERFPLSSPSLPQSWIQRLEGAARDRRAAGLARSIVPSAGVDFSSNDYLGLRRDPRLAEAAAAAAREQGSGAGGARLLRGAPPILDALEAALAAWKGKAGALLFNTGFQCNASMIPALAGAGDAVFSDRLNHASIVDGCRLARAGGATLAVYAHGDVQDLDRRLGDWRAQGGRGLALVVTDAVFSMDGDAADLPGLMEAAGRHGALLLVDEAHATGLLGPTGAGLAERQGVSPHLVMGTLGKALGVFGAFVASDALVRDHLVNTCRGFIFSTALPPPVAGAALEGLRIARSEPWRRERALALASRIRSTLGLEPQPSAIVPIVVGEAARAVKLASELQARGLDVRAVRPPTVPEGGSRLRITTGAHLQDQDVDRLLAALKELL
jgi:8-amino-7-oxononanoate synthase